MVVNNPVYTLRMVDLVETYRDYDFTFNDVIEVIKIWLADERIYFVNSDPYLWEQFIERFVVHFYSRNFNFTTDGEFKVKFRDVLCKYKDRAKRTLEAGYLDINPLLTYRHSTDRNEKTIGDSNNSTHTTNENATSTTQEHTEDVHNESTTDVTDTPNNTVTDATYNLHSESPSNSINVQDLISVTSNYITDANNAKNVRTTIGTDVSNAVNKSTNIVGGLNSTDMRGSSTVNGNSVTAFENNNTLTELSEGFDGSLVDLVEKYMNLTTDVINKYIEWIEEECLFSNVLY